MNSTSSTYRFLTILASIAALGTVAFAIGLAFDVRPLAFFSIAASAMIVLGVARDYAPTLSYAGDAGASAANGVTASRTNERHPLAA